MYTVKAIWMKNDYTWRKMEKKVETKEQANTYLDNLSRRLNKLLNKGFIKDYRVEY